MRASLETAGRDPGSWTFSGSGPRQMTRDGSIGVRWMAPECVVEVVEMGDGMLDELERLTDEAYV